MLAGTIVGIELLNEPATFYAPGKGPTISQIQQYYKDGYDVVRKYLPAEAYYVVIEGAFQPTVSSPAT